MKQPAKSAQRMTAVKQHGARQGAGAGPVVTKPAPVKKPVTASGALSSTMEKAPPAADMGSDTLESGLSGFEDDIAEEFTTDLDDDMSKDLAESFDGGAGFGALAEDRDDDMTEDDLSEELGTEKYFRGDADAESEDDDLSGRW